LGTDRWSRNPATYASWLNQVELWFAKVKRDLLARGLFTSVADLAGKLRRFTTKYNERAKPVRWAHADYFMQLSPRKPKCPAHKGHSHDSHTGHSVPRLSCQRAL
jgi:hypothetical protein